MQKDTKWQDPAELLQIQVKQGEGEGGPGRDGITICWPQAR